MDLFSASVFLISFVVCLALVYFFSVLGTKEQTYEDALRLSRKKMGVDAFVAKDKKDKKAKWSKKPEKSKEPGKTDTQPVSEIKNDEKQSKSSTPEPPIEEETVLEERPIVDDSVSLSAAGKTKKTQRKKMTVEDVDKSCDISNATMERTPVDEPTIVREEAVLLYENDQPKDIEPSPLQEKSKGRKKGVASSIQKSTEGAKKPQLQPHDLLSAVKKTTFEEEELQNLIDILLNKQQGSFGNMNGGWVERGGQASEIKQLEKSLQDTRTALMEETSKVKSLTERWNQVRQEMNMAKAQQAQAQRIAEGHQQELQKYQQRIQQEESRRITEVNNLQNQITYKHQQCQQLQATVERLSLATQLQQQQPTSQDMEAVRGELEQSKQAYSNLDQEVSNLRNQIGLKQTETANLKKELNQVQTRSSEELLKAKEETRKLELRCTTLEKESKDSDSRRKSESEKQGCLESKVDEMSRTQSKLEADLRKAKDSIQSYEHENTLLKEDNDRLSKKLLSIDESHLVKDTRNGNVSPKTNGSTYDESLLRKFEDEKEALINQVQDAKKEIQVITNQKILLQAEAKEYKDKVDLVTQDLNELRNRNDDGKKAKEDVEKSQKNLLSRLFPEIDVQDREDFSSWMDDFSSKVSCLKSNLAKEPSGSNSSVEDLKKQVHHYKKVLSDTESILHRLQSSIETEECQWKQKLAEKESEVDSLKRQLSGSNSAMKTSLDVVQSAEEMEEKLKELQKKLLLEEESKETQSAENKKLSKKLEELEATIESEQKVKAELGEQVARMNQIVATGQDALQQEQKTVELLRDQVAALKAQIPAELLASNETAVV